MSKGSIKQGEIWIVDFEPQVGAEINKTRPAVVIGRNDCVNFGIKIVVPITTWKDKFYQGLWFVKIQPNSKNNLLKPSAANCFQIKSFSHSRFLYKIGELDENHMQLIRKTINSLISKS